MEAQPKHWLPLTEYALRSGMSISTLRRKIKSNSISYKMEDGRYLIQSDDLVETVGRGPGFSSSDAPFRAALVIPATRPANSEREASPPPAFQPNPQAKNEISTADLELLRAELRRMREEDILRWKALEARVSGLAKKLEFFSEQIAETKMLVKIFEEKLDNRAQ